MRERAFSFRLFQRGNFAVVMLKYILPLLLSALLLPLACFGQSGISPFKANLLKVGITPDSPPLAFEVEGHLQGVEVEFAKLLGKALGRPIQFVKLPWQEQIPALLESRTDIIMSGMSITREREEEIAFSEPYVEYGQMAMVRNNDSTRYPQARNVMSTFGKVAVISGTTGEAFVENFFPNASVETFPSPDDAVRALVKSNVDVFIFDSPTILWLSDEYQQEAVSAVPINLTVEYLGWGMRKSDSKLQEQVNAALAKLQEAGEITWVLDRWLPKRPKF